MDISQAFGLRRQGCHSSSGISGAAGSRCRYCPVLPGVRRDGRRRPRHSHQNRLVRRRFESSPRRTIRPATQCGTRQETERASQGGNRRAVRHAIDGWAEAGVDALTDSSAEFAGLRAADRHAEPGARRGTERRAKSLNDSNIDGGSERGLEPRGHPGSDPPAGSPTSGYNVGPRFLRPGGFCRGPQDSCVIFGEYERINI